MLQLRDYQRASLDALQAAWVGQGGGSDPGRADRAADRGGKALVIAALARETLEREPGARIVVVTHAAS